MMNKRITALLLILCTVFALAACGERIPPVNPVSTGTHGTTTGSGQTPDKPGDANAYTVTVMLGGRPFTPPAVSDDADALKVRVSDGKNFYTATVGEDGVATIPGLDGDYSVSLLNVPEEYTHNPNIYKIGNNNRHIQVELLTLGKTYGQGTDMYSKSIKLERPGIYRANISREGQVIYYQYTPRQAGRYCFESMMDTTAEMFNPKAELYTGTFASWYYQRTLDDGGASGSYTKNFRYTFEIAEEELGGNFLIAVKVEGKDAVYPTYVDFSLSYLGTVDETQKNTAQIMGPTFIPDSISPTGKRDDTAFLAWRDELHAHLDADKALHGESNYIDAALRIGDKRVFEQDYYRLNPDDGLYHVFDLEKYPATNGWGPILYADITAQSMFIGSPLHTIEYAGNNGLTVAEGTLNYKLFIEGYDVLSQTQASQEGSYFCNSDCPCYLAFEAGKPGNNGGVCTVEDRCTECNPGCRHIPAALKYQQGYANIVNADGRAPVTEELKTFLQLFSIQGHLFADGEGFAEGYSPRYDAYEDSQWLFACGYYYG